MAKKRKPRSDAKMYQLPKDILEEVNGLLINHNMSYSDIVTWLAERGHKISQSSLSRYAIKMYEAAQRIVDDLEKTKHIIEVVGKNPDLDTTKATTAILKSGLLQKISTAEEEFNDLPVERAGKLLIQLYRAEAALKKNDFDMRSKIDLAFEKLKDNIMLAIKSEPDLSKRLCVILDEAQEKMLENSE